MDTAKKIKILYIITKGKWGGAQKYVFELATTLPKEQFDISVLVGNGNSLPERLAEKGVRVIRLETLNRDINIFSDIKAFFELISILKKEKPNIIHLNSSKAGIMGTVAGRLVGIKKIVFTGHGWAFNEDRNIFSRFVIKLLHWFTILLTNKTIAVSEKTKNDISQMPFLRNKIEVIYNGIKIQKIETKKTAREKLLPSKSGENFLWLGTISELHKNKGLDVAINGFSKISYSFPQAIFVIIGDGEEKGNLKKLAENLGVEEKVFFLGDIPEANKYLSALDIFSLISRTEALPYVILEAGIAGLPVVATEVGGIPEIIENKKNGILIPKENIERFADALTFIMRDENIRNLIAKNLKETVSEKFNMEKMLKETIAIYKG